jgi:uncharacterized membrane protein YfcA
VRVFTGAATIAFVLYNWTGPTRLAKDVDQHSVPAGLFWGALSGFASCIAQAGGPPYQVYALAQTLPKMTYVGTTAIAFATLNWLKVGPYIALGQFSTTGLGTSLVLVPLAVATNLLGFWMIQRVSQELFFKITLLLMFAISCELVREGVIQIWRG